MPPSKKRRSEEVDLLLIGFQGKEGAFSDVAARSVFDELKKAKSLNGATDFKTVGFNRFSQVFEAIEKGELHYGVLPAENSLTGTFHAVLDQLIASNLKIVGEVSRVHEFCLCAPEKSNLNEIKRVLSHPTVLEHCANYISQLEQKQTERKKPFQIDRQATWDSAGACQIVKNEGKINVAAIASEQAACNHGLKVLEKGVGDELNNETRYMILGKSNTKPLQSGDIKNKKSSIVIAVPNQPQALFKIVAAFALRNMTIVRIESRPAATAGSLFSSTTYHWDYIFYVDFVPSADEKLNSCLWKNLEEFALWVKDLGTYTSSFEKANNEPPRWKKICNVIGH